MNRAPHLDLFRAIVQVARDQSFHLLAGRRFAVQSRQASHQAVALKDAEDENSSLNGTEISRSVSTSFKKRSWRGRRRPSVSTAVKVGGGASARILNDRHAARTNNTAKTPWTSAESAELLSVLDAHFVDNAPPEPPPPPSIAQPIPKPHLSPEARSKFLAQLHHSDPQTSYAAYASLFLATSTSATFTPSELYHVARQSVASTALSKAHQKRRLEGVLEELDYAVGPESALGGIQVTKVVSAGRHTRKVRLLDLQEAESAFARAFPANGGAHQATSPAFVSAGNHLLYLAAMIPSQRDFGRIEESLMSAGWKRDSYACLAKITLLRQMKRPESIPDVVSQALDPESETMFTIQPQDRIVIINAALWAFAKLGRWDIVGPAYNALHATASRTPITSPLFDNGPNLEFFSTSPHQSLAIPPDVLPSAVTYRLLIHALAYHGNFVPALTTFQHMLEQADRGIMPCVADYNSLFHGFARFGVVAAPSIDAVAGFPEWNHPEPIGLVQPASTSKLGSRTKSRGARLAEMWERGAAGTATPERAVNQDWTFEALGSLFGAFMGMPPPPSGTRIAPTPRAIYYMLLAFARTSGADREVLRDVWLALKRKFGDGNPEGWTRWTVNARLRRMAELWEDTREQEVGEPEEGEKPL